MVEGDNWPIATERVKWSAKYQKKHGIADRQGAATCPTGCEAAIGKIAKRVYRALELTGYARIDIRMDAAGKVYVLEPIPIRRLPTARTSPSRPNMPAEVRDRSIASGFCGACGLAVLVADCR